MAKKRGRPKKERLLTRRELAKILGVHMMTVTKWEQEGMPIAQRGGKGRPSHYRELDVRAWRERREEAARNDPAGTDLNLQRARREKAQAVLAEQAAMIRARDLLPRDEVEKAWSAEVAAVRTKLLSWSTTLADRLYRASTIEGLPGIERVLQDAVHEVLRELSEPGGAPTASPGAAVAIAS